MAAAQTLASVLATVADFGRPVAAASPITWIFSRPRASSVVGSAGHQPLSSVRPAAAPISPAISGGIRLTTSPTCLAPSAVISVRSPTSTSVTRPVSAPWIRSIMPG